MKTLILFIILIIVPFILHSQTTGIKWTGKNALEESVHDIMAREIIGQKPFRQNEAEKDHEYPDRSNLPQNPSSPFSSSSHVVGKIAQVNAVSPQTVALNFTGATLSGTNPTLAFPPDDMGAVGPTQYIIDVNGRIVTFNKTTGTADGVINTDNDAFFTSVMSTHDSTFTSDPRIRYDKLSRRWFLIIIDVPGGKGKLPNNILIAVSSDSTITASTTFKFFSFQHDLVSPAGNTGAFFDYPSLGIDQYNLYIAGNIFSPSYSGATGFMVTKNSILGSGPIVVYAFRNLGTASTGITTAQGVNNFDLNPTQGYFIGVDQAAFGIIDLYRISNISSGTPTISTIIQLTIAATQYPVYIPHKGNTGGNNGMLDCLNDRLYSAMIRKGHLWTAHNIGVNNTGVSSGSITRNGSRWYDIINYSGTPSVNQYGTVYFPNTTNQKTDRNYWNPSVAVNGQGHAAMGFSTAGTNEYINAGYTGRLSTDASGTMQTSSLYTTSTTAYNPPNDVGGSTGRRWGDYSYTAVDPSDDMTMWTVQQFCDATNSYGCRIAKLLAPAPATITSVVPPTLGPGSNLTLVVNGDASTGLGFFDPGAAYSNHISANINGGIVVNSVTYNSPSTVTLNVTTTGGTNGVRTITITNPDGQVVSNNTLFTYNSSLPVELVSFKGEIVKYNQIKISWSTATEINSSKFELERSIGNEDWTVIGSVYASGNSNSTKKYSYIDKSSFQKGLYSYRLKEYDNDGMYKYFNTIQVNYNQLPEQFGLAQNYPNPFNPTTTISYSLPVIGMVKLNIYNAIGENVFQLVNGVQEAGYHDITFNASTLPSGVYFYSIQTNSVDGTQIFTNTKKMMLLK